MHAQGEEHWALPVVPSTQTLDMGLNPKPPILNQNPVDPNSNHTALLDVRQPLVLPLSVGVLGGEGLAGHPVDDACRHTAATQHNTHTE